ncbi:hypothetical protein ACFWNN_40655 [Lentzea sp. NPDC058450]|uniref:hypothetical protein n=1 Tax=Lentzea sp. NPDC058450 TaxID=3346505 RepID=UPI0036633FF7
MMVPVAPAAASSAQCSPSVCREIASGLGEAVGIGQFEGTAFVTYQTGRLRAVDLATGAQRPLASGLGNLRGVAADSTGVYVADYNGRVQHVDPRTGAARVLASGLGNLQGLTRHGGLTYVVGGETLWQIGTTVRPIALGRWMAMDVTIRDGRAFVAHLGGSIAEVDLGTGHSRAVVSNQYEPTSVGVLDDGTLYFLAAAFDFHRVSTAGRVEEVLNFAANDFDLEGDGTALVLRGTRLFQLTGLS